MIYNSKLTEEQKLSLKKLQADFAWNDNQLDYLLACMAFESGLDPHARNKISGAVGLIQFMPVICKAYGTTATEMRQKSFVEQIPFIKIHFKPYYKRTKTLSDMYMAILMPKFIGKPEDTPVFVNGKAYDQNKGLDHNKDHIVTKQEACLLVRRCYDRGLKDVCV